MSYAELILPRPGEFLLLLVVAWVALVLMGLGRLMTGRLSGMGQTAILLTAGWGVAVFFFDLVGTLTPLSLYWPACILALAGLAGFILLARDIMIEPADMPKGMAARNEWRILGRILLLATPLILLVTAMRASQWDEFSHWLPNAHFLALHHRFPSLAIPNPASSWPAYPYAMSMLSYAASLVQGAFSERSGLIFNLLLLIAASSAIAGLIADGSEKQQSRLRLWGMAAAGLLLAIPLNPSFVAKIAFTNYVDSATSCVLAIMLVTALRWQRAADSEQRLRLALTLGFCAVALIGLKQSNIVLFALFMSGFAFALLVERRLGRDAISLVFALPLPLLIFLLWQHYSATEIPGGAMPFRAYADWHWQEMGSTIRNMVSIATRKSGHFALMLALLAAALFILWRIILRRPLPLNEEIRLAIMTTATIFAGYTGFLLFSYLVSFTSSEATTAASFWRYSTHIGMSGMIAAIAAVLPFWRARTSWQKPLSITAILLVLLIPLAMARNFRFDLDDPHDGFALSAARDMESMLPADARLALLDLYGDAGSLVAMRYELAFGRTSAMDAPLFDTIKLGKTGREFVSIAPDGTYLWLDNGGPDMTSLFGIDLPEDASYLLHKKHGAYELIRVWPQTELTEQFSPEDFR